MKPKIRKRLIISGLLFLCLIALVNLILIFNVAYTIPESFPMEATYCTEDPPKEKKSKKDTTKIDIEQMQEINKQMEMDNKLFDSLIMQIDTLKKKK